MDHCFPYPEMRMYQDELIHFILEHVSQGRNVLFEAATGFGKTICVLSSLLPVADLKGKKIVYCCRTHKQMDRVIDELNAISSSHPISGISLRGRRDMCLHPTVKNHAMDTASALYLCKLLRSLDRCEYHLKFKEKQEQVYEMEIALSRRPSYSSEILDTCMEAGICPYDFIKEVAKDVDVVACSYMYLFHPPIRENFLEIVGCHLEDMIVVLDEAHNLPDLAIRLGSDVLSTISLKAAQKEAEEYEEPDILFMLQLVEQVIEQLAQKYELDQEDEVILSYVELVNRLPGGEHKLLELFRYMRKVGEEIQKDRLKKSSPPRSYIHGCAFFLINWLNVKEREDYCYLIKRFYTRRGYPAFRLEIVDLDPRNISTQVLGNVHASVSMSGTLTPLHAFAEVVGLNNYESRTFPTPFHPSNMFVAAVRGVTTKGNFRSQEMYRKLAVAACEVIDSTPQNVGVFAASYEVLNGLLSAGLKLISSKPLFIESREYTSRQNDELVKSFKESSREKGAVLLGVMGGRNAEGEDFPGDQMNAVVLVGIPYAQPTSRVEAQIRYYSRVFPNKGKYYGYFLPAHRKLNQGAGRAHRMVTDKAAIIFLDERVIQPFVRKDIAQWIRSEMKMLEDKEDVLGRMVNQFFLKADESHRP
jgi:DNA excision repair protein ERCC-2